MAPERTTETPAHPAPILLPPRGSDADPAPLLDTLVRVAVAIVQRRASKDSAVAAEPAPAESDHGKHISFTG